MPRNSSTFYPRFNVYGTVITNQPQSTLFNDGVYFGVDASEKDGLLFIGKDIERGFKSYEEIIGNIGLVNETFQSAIPLLAKSLAAKIHGKLQ
jgi:hypothetical protein